MSFARVNKGGGIDLENVFRNAFIENMFQEDIEPS